MNTAPQLAGGATSTAISSDGWSIPKKDGTHTAQAVVDPANAVSESNEQNNAVSLGTFRVKGVSSRQVAIESDIEEEHNDA